MGNLIFLYFLFNLKNSNMNRLILFFTIFFATFQLSVSQNSLEFYSGLRNSQNIYGGSARFMGMGGAFTALGGDISSISLNPAGLGVYSGNQIVFTPSFQLQNTETNTLTEKDEDSKYRLNFHNIGLISSFKIRDSRWQNINIGLGYNQMNDFTNSVKANYFNTDNSLMHNFLFNYYNYGESSNYETLAFETGLMYSYVNNANDTIGPVTDITDAMNYSDTTSMSEIGVRQVKTIENKGSLGEYFFSFSGNYAHKLYLGMSVGIQRINYNSTDTHKEIDETNQINEFDDISEFQSFSFIVNEERSGTGYNFKLGAIYKPTNFLRIGASYHSPTFFKVENIWYSSLIHQQNINKTNRAEGSNNKLNYRITTSSKLIGGLAFQFEDVGMISFDYERINYSKIELDSDNSMVDFSPENDNYNKMLGEANNFRAGGELKFDQIYVRAGFSYYDSPYKKDYEYFQSATQIYSGGIGYREKSFFIDATFSTSFSDQEGYIFDSISNTNGLVPGPVKMNQKRNKIMVTTGFRF